MVFLNVLHLWQLQNTHHTFIGDNVIQCLEDSDVIETVNMFANLKKIFQKIIYNGLHSICQPTVFKCDTISEFGKRWVSVSHLCQMKGTDRVAFGCLRILLLYVQ